MSQLKDHPDKQFQGKRGEDATVIYVAADGVAAKTQIVQALQYIILRHMKNSSTAVNEQQLVHLIEQQKMATPLSDLSLSLRVLNGEESVYVVSSPASDATCHIEADRSFDCVQATLRTWFQLALSDNFVLQGFVDPELPATQQYLRPVSSFSRTASWYSLTSPHARLPFQVGSVREDRKILFAHSSPSLCQSSAEHWAEMRRNSTGDDKRLSDTIAAFDMAQRGLLPQGNWVCTDGNLY